MIFLEKIYQIKKIILYLFLRTSYKKLIYYETKLISHVNIPYKIYQVNLQNNIIKFNYLNNEYINTFEIISNIKNKPVIVVIHGFASGIATFVNMYKPLNKYCHVYAIDLIGFGRSSKPNFLFDSIYAENLFVDSIEVWRIKQNLGSIILCAHSFGAYIATKYSYKYPKFVKSLILLEPWGFYLPKNMIPKYNYINILNYKINPLYILKLCGPLALSLMYYICYNLWNKTFIGIGVGDEIFKYLYHSNVQCTGDTGFILLLKSFYFAKRPIHINDIDFKIDITLIYGSNSWIDNRAGKYAYNIRKKLTFIEIISNAGHQIYAVQLDMLICSLYRAIQRIL